MPPRFPSLFLFVLVPVLWGCPYTLLSFITGGALYLYTIPHSKTEPYELVQGYRPKMCSPRMPHGIAARIWHILYRTDRHEQWKRVARPRFFLCRTQNWRYYCSGEDASPLTTGVQKGQSIMVRRFLRSFYFIFMSFFFLNDPIAGTPPSRHVCQKFHANIPRPDCVGPTPKVDPMLKLSNYKASTQITHIFRTKVQMSTPFFLNRSWFHTCSMSLPSRWRMPFFFRLKFCISKDPNVPKMQIPGIYIWGKKTKIINTSYQKLPFFH